MRLIKSAVIASVMLSASPQAMANQITNGNFISVSGSGFIAPGWALSGAVRIIPYTSYGLSGTYAGSPNGAVFGYTNVVGDPNLLSQTFSTAVGTTYALTFDYGSYSGYSSLIQSIQTSVVDTTSSSLLLSTVVSTPNSSTSSLNAMFSTHPSLTFTATGSSTMLSFSDVSAVTSGVDSFLTNVSVVSTSTISQNNSVPEPGALALFGAGLIALASRRSKA